MRRKKMPHLYGSLVLLGVTINLSNLLIFVIVKSMKILSVKSLTIPDVKVIRFARFRDHRGYFTETFRRSDFNKQPELSFLSKIEFVQNNESYSSPKTVRGLHFQWQPPMGKLVRTLNGRMIDLALDIRKGSPTFGVIIAYDMPAHSADETGEWIWVPPGFAHGNVFTEETMIEYYCSASYNPQTEAGISPLSPDLNWSQCEEALKKIIDSIAPTTDLISQKDKNALTLKQWELNSRSDYFKYGPL